MDWPIPEIWDCWRAQQGEDATTSTAVLDKKSSSTADVAVLWQAKEAALAGFTAICDVAIQPRHSPLVPALVNLLKVDKAAARAMYEETNARRRQILTSVLSGELSQEDNPLQLDVQYLPSQDTSHK